MRKGFLSVWAASVALVAFALSHTQADTGKRRPSQPEFKPGEVVVKLKSRAPSGRIASFATQARVLSTSLGKRYAMTMTSLRTDAAFLKVKVKTDAPIGQVIADIQASGVVEYAEPNYIYRAFALDGAETPAVTPNDPSFNLDWGLLNIGQKDSKGQEGVAGADIDATKAWGVGTGSRDIVVAVIDTGVDYNHEDLKANAWTNAGETAGNGKDDDGNGFVDDVNGWNFERDVADPMDDNRHGTHCSGTIGAEGNNGVGTAGVSWQVRIMPLKFLSAGGSGTLADAVDAIKYATKMGANVMSNSWGGGGYSQAMFDAIKEAREKGILFVAAAGNEGNNNDTSPAYPASYDLDNVISVAATDNRDQKASWSNYGARRVHLGAPGVNIYSTVPTNKGGYDTFSGTSMACPHVSGAAALLWSLNRSMTYTDIKARLLATVDPVRVLKRKTVTGGRLNVYNAVMNIVPERREPPADAWKTMAKSVESAHPYANNASQTFEITHPGARFIRVRFAKVGTESGYDLVRVKSASGEVMDELSGDLTAYTSDYVEGDKIVITFTSDTSVEGWGFSIDQYEFIE